MFKIHTGVVPEYLREIVQNKRGNISKYNTRNKRQYDIPRCNKNWKYSIGHLYQMLTKKKELVTCRKTPPQLVSFARLYLRLSFQSQHNIFQRVNVISI